MAFVKTDDTHYTRIAGAIRALHDGEETYTPAQMAEYLSTEGAGLKPWNIAEGITVFGVTGTLKLCTCNTGDWPEELPVDKDAFDDAATEFDPDVDTNDAFLLLDDKGNVTVGFMYGSNFIMNYCNWDTTEFKAKGWLRVSYHTTGELAGQITVDDFRIDYSGGWNYYKNIRWSTRDAIYAGSIELWPNPNFYRYGNLVLPPIPERNKTTYPYAMIVGIENNSLQGSLKAIYTAKPWEWSSAERAFYAEPGSGYLQYRLYLHSTGNAGWAKFTEGQIQSLGKYGSYGVDEAPRWADYDINDYQNNTVYLEASEPVKLT